MSHVKDWNQPLLNILGAVVLLALALTLTGCCGLVWILRPDPVSPMPGKGAVTLILKSSTANEPLDPTFARWTFGEMEATLSVFRYRPSAATATGDSLKIDLMISPKDFADKVNFRPQNIRVAVGHDTLSIGGTKILDYGCYGWRQFDAYFAVPTKAMAETGSDSVWCRVDLTGAFIYDGTPLEFGPITGRLPVRATN